MILRRARGVLARAKAELHRSFTEEYSSRETAGSFSLGVFITMLPTLGTGLIAFVVLAWLFSRINRIALFASVIVFNPVVKWGVYGTSFALGTTILGPVPGVTPSSVSLSAGPAIVGRLVLGNLILAVVAAGISYVAAHRVVVAYERREFGVVDTVTDVVGGDGGDDGPGAIGDDGPGAIGDDGPGAIGDDGPSVIDGGDALDRDDDGSRRTD
ncbi:DUF2062 domain-containing protein [Halorubrum trueperi]|uniref:DUF2062 domain-containing protein n=1 Tax=Halorubrum trueperi TaxID=2004704 RepID=A0ABD5UEZ5_9EURY